MRLRLITWNLHGPPLAWRQTERFRAAALRILRSTAPLPDFVLLQEVWFPSKGELLIEVFSPAYDAVDVPRNFFPGRAGGLLALVRRDSGWRLRTSSFEAFRSAAPALRFWEGDGLASKGFQRLDLEREGQALVIYNTHLQAQYNELSYSDVRRDQIIQINNAARLIPGALPVLAAGDFNTTPREPLYNEVAALWTDLTRQLRERCNCGTTIQPSQPSEWIDYVLARQSAAWSARCETAERLENTAKDEPYSDHHGLDLTLELEPAVSLQDIGSAAALAMIHGPSTRRQWLTAWAALVLQRALR